jgi:hypothetical protein
MAEQPLPDHNTLHQVIDLLVDSQSDNDDARQVLATISMVCPGPELRKCLDCCLSRYNNHRRPSGSWTAWEKLDGRYQEVLIWTISALADRLCFENVWNASISEDVTKLFRRAHDVLRDIRTSKQERPTVRDIAREGQMDLENSHLFH